MDTSDLVAVFGRLSAHEFVIEQIIATGLSMTSPDPAARAGVLRADLARQMRAAWTVHPDPGPLGLPIGRACAEAADRLMAKVEQRLRAAAAPAP